MYCGIYVGTPPTGVNSDDNLQCTFVFASHKSWEMTDRNAFNLLFDICIQNLKRQRLKRERGEAERDMYLKSKT